MKKFKIEFVRHFTRYGTCDLEAEDEGAALNAARNILFDDTSTAINWEPELEAQERYVDDIIEEPTE